MYHPPFSQASTGRNWSLRLEKLTSPHFISFGNKHGMGRLLRFEFFFLALKTTDQCTQTSGISEEQKARLQMYISYHDEMKTFSRKLPLQKGS